MLKTIRSFINDRKGGLIENIIYIIIIGALSYTFYTEKVQAPMETNMNTLNNKITEWTTVQTNTNTQ
jgi:hypothetical protein